MFTLTFFVVATVVSMSWFGESLHLTRLIGLAFVIARVICLNLGTRQFARILDHWLVELGLGLAGYGTHSMRRTKATLIYRRIKNLRAIQLLLGHSKLESIVHYLGIEVEDALKISEQTEI